MFTLKTNKKGLTDLYYGKHKIAKNLEDEELLELGLSITKSYFDEDLLAIEEDVVEELYYGVSTLEDLIAESEDYREFYIVDCDDIDY